jgi:hypothetical protein
MCTPKSCDIFSREPLANHSCQISPTENCYGRKNEYGNYYCSVSCPEPSSFYSTNGGVCSEIGCGSRTPLLNSHSCQTNNTDICYGRSDDGNNYYCATSCTDLHSVINYMCTPKSCEDRVVSINDTSCRIISDVIDCYINKEDNSNPLCISDCASKNCLYLFIFILFYFILILILIN